MRTQNNLLPGKACSDSEDLPELVASSDFYEAVESESCCPSLVVRVGWTGEYFLCVRVLLSESCCPSRMDWRVFSDEFNDCCVSCVQFPVAQCACMLLTLPYRSFSPSHRQILMTYEYGLCILWTKRAKNRTEDIGGKDPRHTRPYQISKTVSADRNHLVTQHIL